MKTIQPGTTAPFRRKSARILAGSIAALVAAGGTNIATINKNPEDSIQPSPLSFA